MNGGGVYANWWGFLGKVMRFSGEMRERGGGVECLELQRGQVV